MFLVYIFATLNGTYPEIDGYQMVVGVADRKEFDLLFLLC